MSPDGQRYAEHLGTCGIVSVNTWRPSSSWFVVIIAVPFLRRREALLATADCSQKALGGARLMLVVWLFRVASAAHRLATNTREVCDHPVLHPPAFAKSGREFPPGARQSGW